MSSIRRCTCLAVLAAVLCLGLPSTSRAADHGTEQYHVARTMQIGGEGGWDYATLDASGKLLFLTRGTHTIAIDPATGKTVADFAPTQRAHGVALVPDAGRGFVTDGKAGTVVVFDLKTYAILGSVVAADDADGVIYDPTSRRVFVSCGDAHSVVSIDPTLDPKSGKADTVIDLGGKPEFLAADAEHHLYVNLVDKNQVAVIDTAAGKVIHKWPTGTGTGPTGLALDPKTGRLFVGCRGNQKMVVMSTKDGSVLAELPIGRNVDATAFHDGTAFASCGDGTLAVVRESSPGKFEVVQTVQTVPGARTMTVDARSGTAYLPTADMDPASTKTPGARPKPLPGTFKVLVVEPTTNGR